MNKNRKLKRGILIDIGEGDAFFEERDNYIGEEFTYFSVRKWSGVGGQMTLNGYYTGEITFDNSNLNVREKNALYLFSFKFVKLPIRSADSVIKRFGSLIFTNPKVAIIIKKALDLEKGKDDTNL